MCDISPKTLTYLTFVLISTVILSQVGVVRTRRNRELKNQRIHHHGLDETKSGKESSRWCARVCLRDAQARNIVGDVGHARFVFIRAVGAALGDETRPIAKQREVGAQALGGHQSSK